jgi:tetratricopeptide (TPR) repeat protein
MKIRMISRTLAAVALFCASLPAQTTATTAGNSAGDAADLVKQARKLNSEGKQDEALALYQQALRVSPNLVDAHLGAGAALDLKGQYDQARQHFTKAIELATPENKNGALRNMAFSYAFERKVNEAARYEQTAFDSLMAQQKFTDAAGVANELARIYLESGDVDNAAKWYKTGYDTAFRKTDLKDAEKDLWNFRWEHAQARIAARRGQAAAAQKHVAAAKALLDKGTNSDQAPFYPYLTGYVAFYGGDYKTAISELQKADQRDPFILVLLAQAYEKSGDKTQATEYYRKALASNIHNPTNAFARPIAKQKLGSS